MTREAALDSSALVVISQLSRQKAQALHTDFIVFEPAKFAEKLVIFFCIIDRYSPPPLNFDRFSC